MITGDKLAEVLMKIAMVSRNWAVSGQWPTQDGLTAIFRPQRSGMRRPVCRIGNWQHDSCISEFSYSSKRRTIFDRTV